MGNNKKLYIKYTNKEILPKLISCLIFFIMSINFIIKNSFLFSIFTLCCLTFYLLQVARYYKNKIKRGELLGIEMTEKGIIQYVGKFSGIEFSWEDIETITFNTLDKSLCIELKPNLDYSSMLPFYTKLYYFFSFKKTPSKVCQSLSTYGLSSPQLESFFRTHVENKLVVI